MSDDSDEQKYSIRLCHIVKWENFDGYGFNLHAEKNKPGQYIGKVDENSPAEAAGLKEGDRIIEVNGVNISNENHKQVVQRIKTVPDETKLLVVDKDADSYFKSKNIVIKSDLPNVIHLSTPSETLTESKTDVVDDEDSHISKNGSYFEIEKNGEKTSSKNSSVTTTPSSGRKASDGSSPDLNLEMNNKHDSDSERVIENNKLNLNMTAKELRAQLARRKKYDAKKIPIDLKEKYEIVQKL